jgi:hypothetical protein
LAAGFFLANFLEGFAFFAAVAFVLAVLFGLVDFFLDFFLVAIGEV